MFIRDTNVESPTTKDGSGFIKINVRICTLSNYNKLYISKFRDEKSEMQRPFYEEYHIRFEFKLNIPEKSHYLFSAVTFYKTG